MVYFFTARPWAERGSRSTRGLVTARPWAERGSWFTRGLLLTARPWAERGSRFTRGLFIFFLSVTRRRPPLGQTLSHATCDVFPPEAVKT